MIRPTTVFIHWSEAGHPLNENTTMSFRDFEAAAEEAAIGHPGGSYLKTKITVSFDDGSTYECRLDLGAGYNLERGFEDGIKARIKHYDPDKSMPEGARANLEKCHALWLQMDFSHAPDCADWVMSEIEGIRGSVDVSACNVPNCRAFKIGDKVRCNGYPATVVGVNSWNNTGYEVRVPGGVVQAWEGDLIAEAVRYRTELTRAGEQMVIPGCEIDDPQVRSNQMSLF